MSNLSTEFKTYLIELQLKFDLDALECWKAWKTIYLKIVELSMKYLNILVTSVVFKRYFLTTEYVVIPQRNRLLSENINILVSFYQNRELYE